VLGGPHTPMMTEDYTAALAAIEALVALGAQRVKIGDISVEFGGPVSPERDVWTSKPSEEDLDDILYHSAGG